MSNPEISVIINNYNYGAFVGRAIDSALAQAGPKSEVVVVDDGSTDESRQILKGYGAQIRCVFQPNRGQAAAMNAGVGISRGDILAFLDADDWWLDGKLAAVARAFADAPSARLVYHRLQPTQSDGTIVLKPIPRSLMNGDLTPWMERSGGNWPFPMTSAIAVRREGWDTAGPIPERFRISADAWLVGVQPLLGDVISIPEVLGGYRIHCNNWFRQQDDAGMIVRRMAHWRATVDEINAFLSRAGRPQRISLREHYPYQLAAARLSGATVADRFRLLAYGLWNAAEPNLARRVRNTLRAVWLLHREPMQQPAFPAGANAHSGGQQ